MTKHLYSYLILLLFIAAGANAQGKFTLTYSQTINQPTPVTVSTDTMTVDRGFLAITGVFAPANNVGFELFTDKRISGPGTYSCNAALIQSTFDYNSSGATDKSLTLTITEYDSLTRRIKGTFSGTWLVYTSSAPGHPKDYMVISGSFDYHPALLDVAFTDSLGKDFSDTLFTSAGSSPELYYKLSAVDATLPSYYYSLYEFTTGNIQLYAGESDDTKFFGGPRLLFAEKVGANGFTSYSGKFQLDVPDTLSAGTYKITVRGYTDCYTQGKPTDLIVVVTKMKLTLKNHGVPFLTLDASDPSNQSDPAFRGWRDAGLTYQTVSGLVKANSFVKFKGSLTVDTASNAMTYSGMWYCEIPLPFTGITGTFVLDSATNRSIKINDDAQLIFTPLSLGVDKYISSKLGGFKFRTDSVKFIVGSTPGDATGIQFGCTILIPTLPASQCESDPKKNEPEKNREISLAPIEITNQGIGGAVHVQNLKVYPGFCLNDLFASYYSKPDSLSVGGSVHAPFADIDLSAGWLQGMFNALAFKVNLAKSIPIAQTTLGIKGVFGSMANWVQPPLKLKLGGTINQVASPNLLEITAEMGYEEPSTLSGKVTADFFKTLSVWQVEMSAEIKLNWNSYVSLDGTFKAGNLGTKGDYVIDGSGQLKFTWNPAVDITAKANGTVKIPKIGFAQNALTKLINLALPINLGRTEAQIKNKQLRLNAEVTLPWPFSYSVTGHLVCDLNKSFSDPGFLDFGKGLIPLSTTTSRKATPASIGDYPIVVTADMAQVVAAISAGGSIPASHLVSPSGKSYDTVSSKEDGVYYGESGNTGFWYLASPQVGTWILHVDNMISSDTVTIEGYLADRPLNITSLSQLGNQVSVTWDTAGTSPNSTIDFYLAEDTTGNVGIHVGGTRDENGSFTFGVNDSLPACQYYLYATRDDRGGLVSAYGHTVISTPRRVQQPVSVTSHRIDNSTVRIQWQKPSDTANIDHYVIRITYLGGSDSVFASVGSSVTEVILNVPKDSAEFVSLIAYSESGLTSCCTDPEPIEHLAVTQSPVVVTGKTIEVGGYPNPAREEVTIDFTLDQSTTATIDIFDALGRKIETVSHNRFEAGSYQIPVSLNGLEEGTYYVRVQTTSAVGTAKVVIIK